MKNSVFIKLFALVMALSLGVVACQDNTLSEDIDLVDEDMVAATELAEAYVGSTRGSLATDLSVTVLKFQDGKLLFGTDSDIFNGYEEITEETITATVEPGELIFWFCGGGLSDLDGIEFDETSMLQLVDAPSEIYDGKMWVLTIPEDSIGEDGILKYDIVYQYKGNSGPPIRLDPKIKVHPQD